MISNVFRHQQKVTVRVVKLKIKNGLDRLFILKKIPFQKDQMHIRLRLIRQLLQIKFQKSLEIEIISELSAILTP